MPDAGIAAKSARRTGLSMRLEEDVNMYICMYVCMYIYI